jgi:group I intron endonuclease
MIIYIITNIVNSKKYVGQTVMSLAKRIAAHKNTAKTHNYPLYRAFKKYGLDAFIVEQIGEATNKEVLDKMEVFWIQKLNTLVPNGYNLHIGGTGGSCPGEISLQGKRRIGEAAKKRMTGRIVSEETREKLRLNSTGIRFTEERKRAISEAKKGKPAWNKGKSGVIPSIETRAKMSAAHKGKRHASYVKKPHSEATKQKMSASAKGRPSPLRGRTFSDERKKKQSEAIRLWHQRKKFTSE